METLTGTWSKIVTFDWQGVTDHVEYTCGPMCRTELLAARIDCLPFYTPSAGEVDTGEYLYRWSPINAAPASVGGECDWCL